MYDGNKTFSLLLSPSFYQFFNNMSVFVFSRGKKKREEDRDAKVTEMTRRKYEEGGGESGGGGPFSLSFSK